MTVRFVRDGVAQGSAEVGQFLVGAAEPRCVVSEMGLPDPVAAAPDYARTHAAMARMGCVAGPFTRGSLNWAHGWVPRPCDWVRTPP